MSVQLTPGGSRVGWAVSRAGQRCGSCGSVIPAASPMRRLQSGLIRCAPCAKRWLNEDPPEALLVLLPESAPPAGPINGQGRLPQPFSERFRARLRETDGKVRAGGDD